MIPIAAPQIGPEEQALVAETLASGSLAQGPRVRELEERFAALVGVPYAVATSSGTTALHLAILAAGVGAGDEVVTSPFTFMASGTSVLYAGGRPMFVDVDPRSFMVDPDRVEAAITPRTKAIMPVSLYGQPADLPALEEIAQRRGIALIEDAAQTHGASIDGRMSGSFGQGVFSFYPTKNMTTGEGGMITTADERLSEWARLRREHGMKVRYHHDVLGYNFRMTDIHAAIGLAQLDKLERFNARRIATAARYEAELRGVVTPWVRPGTVHVFHQYTIRVLKRDAFVERLRERGVGTGVYYPIPLHRQVPFVELGYGDQSFPVSEQLCEEVVSIPVHPGLSDADVDAVIEAVNGVAAELGSHPESTVAA